MFILDPNFIPASDNTILVKFGDGISENLHLQVLSFTQYLLKNPAKEITNISPGYNSILIRLSNTTRLDESIDLLKTIGKSIHFDQGIERRKIKIPVCYNPQLGLDLKRVMRHTAYGRDEVIKRHTSGSYLVHFIGFSAGFPYIGGMDETLATPRLDSPRKTVPVGSVGIAGKQTGIYPLPTPGGWNLIGRTPLKLLNKDHPGTSLVRMGDRIRFHAIDLDEYERLRSHHS